MYAVMSINKTVEIIFYGQVHEIPLTYGKGMIGAIPVFDTRAKAEEFANGIFDVIEVTLNPGSEA